jgi:hypothetical protein
MRFGIVYDEIQTNLATSIMPDNTAKSVPSPNESNADLEIPDEAGDLEPNEATERLPPVSRRRTTTQHDPKRSRRC